MNNYKILLQLIKGEILLNKEAIKRDKNTLNEIEALILNGQAISGDEFECEQNDLEEAFDYTRCMLGEKLERAKDLANFAHATEVQIKLLKK